MMMKASLSGMLKAVAAVRRFQKNLSRRSKRRSRTKRLVKKRTTTYGVIMRSRPLRKM